jgi:hypothetical protein
MHYALILAWLLWAAIFWIVGWPYVWPLFGALGVWTLSTAQALYDATNGGWDD